MRGSRVLVIGLTFVSFCAFIGCRTARGTKGMLPSGPIADFTRDYAGQMRILAGFGEDSHVKLTRGGALATGCDAAVLVTSAVLEGGSARFELELIGLPRIDAKPYGRECRKAPRSYSLILTDLETEKADEEVDRVLQTPERYLTDRGVEFAYEPSRMQGPVADKRLHTTAEERSLARTITTPHKRLLSVVPVRREKSKDMRYQGEVTFLAVIGADGRLHETRLIGSYGVHADRIVKVLDLWRYEPARRGDEAVAFRAEERTVFRVY
ncbi:MAG: hypothetical protein JXO72_10115 [Vicinamibacteria bacterium]|nr:hypothetical protein [Vicinamibacteria bacterium]